MEERYFPAGVVVLLLGILSLAVGLVQAEWLTLGVYYTALLFGGAGAVTIVVNCIRHRALEDAELLKQLELYEANEAKYSCPNCIVDTEKECGIEIRTWGKLDDRMRRVHISMIECGTFAMDGNPARSYGDALAEIRRIVPELEDLRRENKVLKVRDRRHADMLKQREQKHADDLNKVITEIEAKPSYADLGRFARDLAGSYRDITAAGARHKPGKMDSPTEPKFDGRCDQCSKPGTRREGRPEVLCEEHWKELIKTEEAILRQEEIAERLEEATGV